LTSVHPKVAAAAGGATIGPAIVDIAVWILSSHGFVVPEHIQNDFSIIASAALSFAAGWLTPAGNDAQLAKPAAS
jgi:hypothetical protein